MLTFQPVNVKNSLKLRPLVPENIIFVSESGLKTAQDIQKLKDGGYYTIGMVLKTPQKVRPELHIKILIM